MVELRLPSPVTAVRDDRLGIRLYLKRDDLINPELPGNKWRKLKYNIAAAREGGYSTLLTFGGAYSNHIRATAAAGYHFGFRTIGVIRGEEHLPLNDSLAYAVGRGMSLRYVDRATYRRKTAPDVLEDLRGDSYVIPEGGSNGAAVRGCAELVGEIDVEFDTICCACGTGGTLAGISAGLGERQSALGFSVLRGDFLAGAVAELQRVALGRVTGNWSVNTDFHFGGYARNKPELQAFADGFGARHGIVLERVYVAKMMYGIYSLAEQGYFPRGSSVVALITG